MLVARQNQYFAHFAVSGDFEASEITYRFDLQPSQCWNKGDRSEANDSIRTFSRWSLGSRLDRSSSLEKHAEDVLLQMRSEASKFAEIAKNFDAYLQLVAYIYQDFPGLILNKGLVEGFAQFAVNIDFDFYYLHSSEREAVN